MNGLIPYAQLGAATGLRSMAGISQLSRELAELPGDDLPDRRAVGFLSRSSVRETLQLAVFGEMIADKLPTMTSRLEPGPLAGRAVLGMVAGGVMAMAREESITGGAVAGGVGAMIGSFVGYHARRALTNRAKLPDLLVALCEDAVAIATARHAVRT
jgi:uncharacterized membrane protein